MPTGIEITTDDVQRVERELQLQLDDAERLAVLKEVSSCDVQAGPGSGKTTVLIAKLAILAKHWPCGDRGICVLSHTNAARLEIEKQLTKSPELGRLLHYPHYIGTIQTFVDQFLAIPFLRRERVEVTTIDNDRFGVRAWAILSSRFPRARFAIERYFSKAPERAQWLVSRLRLDGAHLGVTHPCVRAKRFPKAGSATGCALIAVKQSLQAEGCFRFDDMYAFAEACLFKVPYVAPALRRRFPWVFVDELQDTSATQDRVIEHIFAAEDCVFQRLGDRNQAIFDFDGDSDDAPSLFGARKLLPLNTTRRFGNSIARLVSPLTAIEPQVHVGNPIQPDLDHTVFIFDRDAVKQVVPRFGDLVLRTVPQAILDKQPVCVVGNRVNPASFARDNFPALLGDYTHAYVPPKSAKPSNPDTFLGHIGEARTKWATTGSGAEPSRLATSGVLALLRRASTTGPDTPLRTKAALHQSLLQSGRFTRFQKLLWNLLNPTVTLDKDSWTKHTEDLLDILGLSKPTAEVLDFLKWESCAGIGPAIEPTPAVRASNTVLHRSGDASLTIRFDSIHAVKGQTHAATLVVETFATQHDLKALLPVLTAQEHGSGLDANLRSHCKRVFVAMTRPSHLLCLAISAEHIDDAQIALLRANGWKVERVQAPAAAPTKTSASPDQPGVQHP